MKRTLGICVLLLSATAFADWPAETNWAKGMAKAFTDAYGAKPELVLAEVDLDGKAVDPVEIGKRPGGGTVGATCGFAIRELAKYATSDKVREAMKGVATIKCQYAHYYKGEHDKPIQLPDRTIPGGNATDKNEPVDDNKIVFEPAKGPMVQAITIVYNRHLYDVHWRELTVDKAMKARFAATGASASESAGAGPARGRR